MPVQVTITGAAVRRVLLGMLIGVALGGLVWLGMLLFAPDEPFGGAIDEDRFQAVFLQNEQVYFGRLREGGGDFYELREAFFIQQVPGEEEDAPPTQQVRSVSEEFHQPHQDVLLRKDAVVRVDNLPPDSEVAMAIQRVLEAQGG